MSGTHHHFLAVSKKGRVFRRGANKDGQLGLGKVFPSLVGYEIRVAYAGGTHSLFEK